MHEGLSIRLLRRVAPSRLANDRKISKELDLSDFPVLNFSIIEPPHAKKTSLTPIDCLK
jgi:hypothetical protein